MALTPGDSFGFVYQGQYETAEIISINELPQRDSFTLELRTDSGIALTETFTSAEIDEMNIADLENYLTQKYETFEC